jgi:hypothetical protein
MKPAGPGVAGLALFLIGPAGCAPPNPPALRPAEGAPPIIASNPAGMDIRYRTDALSAETEMRADPARVWEALGAAYGDLQLPVAAADARERTLQSGRFRAPRRIGGEPLAAFLDCGNTLTGRRVDNSDVHIEMASGVRAAGADAALLATLVTASARARDGTSTAAVPCTSTGELEKLVAARVRERVGG